MLLEKAIAGRAVDLMDSLLAERETLGIPPTHHMESSVRPAIDLALQNADHMLESVIDQLEKASQRLDKDDMRKDHLVEMLRKHRESRNEIIENFERELFRAAGFAEVILNYSEDSMERFIHKQPYYRQEILPRWVYLMFTHVQTSHPDLARARVVREVKLMVRDGLKTEIIRDELESESILAGDELESEIKRIVRDELESELGRMVRNNLESGVIRKVWNKLEIEFNLMLRDELESELRRVLVELESELRQRMRGQLESDVVRRAEDHLGSELRRMVQNELESEVIQRALTTLEYERIRRSSSFSIRHGLGLLARGIRKTGSSRITE
jgi:hypothetical protein